jgi:HEAT repeat protein
LGLAARGALERLPGPVAGDALRQAIAALSGPALAGVLDSLGERRETASVALAVQALASPDPTVVAAAARALGKIGGREVLLPVRRALDHADPAVREAATDALLRAADGLVAAGVATEARETYELLSDPARPARVRAAAFPGLVASRGEAGGELLLGALTSDEPVFRQAALQCLRSPAGASVSGRLTQALSSLPPPVQAAVIEALAERGDPSALGPVTAAADSAEEMVRLAALRAFGRVGSSASVPLLIRRLPTASPAETRAIRESLARIPGQAVDAALVEVLRSSQGPIRAEMIQVLGARGGAAPEAILLESLSDTDAAVRMAALRALAGAGGEATLRTLVARFAKELSDTERRETELALAGCPSAPGARRRGAGRRPRSGWRSPRTRASGW